MTWLAAPPPASAPLDGQGLFRGEGATSAPDPGASLSVPEDLVDDEADADRRDQAEREQGRDHGCGRDQRQQQNGRDRPASPEASESSRDWAVVTAR